MYIVFYVSDPYEIEPRADQSRRDIQYNKEEETHSCAMRLYRLSGKLGVLYFLNRLLAESPLYFPGRKGNRITICIGGGPGEPSRDVLLGCGRKLGTVHGYQLSFHTR